MISTLIPSPEPTTDYTRHDGWTPARQIAFVSHLADHGNIAAAAKAAGMGLSGAYALRRRREGFAFDLAWKAALVIARNRLLDVLMMRAIDGEEVVTVRDGGNTRKRATNYRLGLSLIDRIKPEDAELPVKMIIADFDAFLEILANGSQPDDLEEFFAHRIRNKMQLEKLLSTLPLSQIPADSEAKGLVAFTSVGRDWGYWMQTAVPANDTGAFEAQFMGSGG